MIKAVGFRIVTSAAVLMGSLMPLAYGTAAPTAAQRDGQHDFDFNVGTWKTHVRRLQHPLTGSSSWVEGDGTVAVRKVWGGRGNLEEIEVTTPAGHLQGLTLRLYNPEARQWRLSWANAEQGVLQPSAIGEFKNGRGEFYDQETFNGKTILVKQVYSDVTPNSYRFEQSFSADRGQTWEPNFIGDLTRTSDDPGAHALSGEHNRDLDWNLGRWDIAVRRIINLVAGGEPNWADYKGTIKVEPIWNGRASISEIEIDGVAGHLQGLTVRLYNPEAHQWSLNWANVRDGTVGVPMIGEFKDGRGDFVDIEDFNGRQIFARNVFSDIKPDSVHFEQAFSSDGGKTWDTNWLMNWTRAK